ncbi:MAG: 2-oxoglutarate dehydrogenase complex dihydrolipoyllysine-residue succinyltransferase [Proteobacteria bacterium]|nr:MAG: 2-oxoglutarate dehydrogenase complex dihydrolipoyllysine-residue succinyltransferase [Pseudomonadota bacterium]TDJ71891.1 MAG: 2-oxoglutarate dehydrogenase complex dihydrolipoyllysine-residue succinyltransferase [Pseudomonadota bacterium]
MRVEVKSPTLPESVAEATLLSWHKQAGESVTRDENLVDIETEKVVLEVPAPQDGVLQEVLKRDGETIGSNEPIAIIETEAASTSASQQSSTTASKERPADEAKPETIDNEAPLSPAVRRLLAEHDLNPAQIPATGKGGRLLKEDVLNFMRQQGEQSPETKVRADIPAPTPSPLPATTPKPRPTDGEPSERRVPMTRLRATIAERLLHAQHEAALLTTFNEVNMQAVMDLRRQYRDRFEKEHGARLGFMSFFIKASTQALKQYPIINASVDGKDIVYHDNYDIGIAVAGARGLVVPVLRNTGQLSFAEIETRIADFGKRAGDGKLTMEELMGGTFTITNGGVFGSLISTPLVNPPQSAILGMHKIQQRPVAEDNEVRIRPMMYLALTYDHRIIDGREAVQFLVALKDSLEDPARLLLEI